jgi:hypothetical protein
VCDGVSVEMCLLCLYVISRVVFAFNRAWDIVSAYVRFQYCNGGCLNANETVTCSSAHKLIFDNNWMYQTSLLAY